MCRCSFLDELSVNLFILAIFYHHCKLMQEKICNIEGQGTISALPARNDSLGQVLGAERPGRVRGMSFGVCPSQVFGSKFERFCGSIPSSSSVSATECHLQSEVEKLQSKVSSDSRLMKEMASTITLLCQKINVPVPSAFSSVTSEVSVFIHS